MPSSQVLTFIDPDDYAASIRRSTIEIAVTGRGQFSAKLTSIDLHRLVMQRAAENCRGFGTLPTTPGAPASPSAHTPDQACS